jgi:LPPG:FO 2-phospho-L-lactate transferase
MVKNIRFAGAESARAAPGVLEAISEAGRIIICPSNPLISIGPILAMPGVRELLHSRKTDVFAVCPIVGGKSLKGPSDKMLAQQGHEPTALGVAKLYADFTGTFVIDPLDKTQARLESCHRAHGDENAQSEAQTSSCAPAYVTSLALAG